MAHKMTFFQVLMPAHQFKIVVLLPALQGTSHHPQHSTHALRRPLSTTATRAATTLRKNAKLLLHLDLLPPDLTSHRNHLPHTNPPHLHLPTTHLLNLTLVNHLLHQLLQSQSLSLQIKHLCLQIPNLLPSQE